MSLLSRKWVLDGEVCTIHLRLAGAADKQFDDLLQHTLRPDRPALEQQLRDSLRESFGPNLNIGSLYSIREGREIVITIDAGSYVVKSCGDFEKALTRFVFHVQDVINKVTSDKLDNAAFHGHWFPGPHLIRMQFEPPEKHRSIMKQLQHPIFTVLLATVLGSLLIPLMQSRLNGKRIRRDERIKLALAIIDQNREVNSQIGALETEAELFAKDQTSPESALALRKQQEQERERHNIRYLSFDAQAWWWYWPVQMKSQLSSLAKPDEAAKLKGLAEQYDKELRNCVKYLSEPWDGLLRNRYDPSNWNNITQRTLNNRDNINNCRQNRDTLALQMAQVLASE